MMRVLFSIVAALITWSLLYYSFRTTISTTTESFGPSDLRSNIYITGDTVVNARLPEPGSSIKVTSSNTATQSSLFFSPPKLSSAHDQVASNANNNKKFFVYDWPAEVIDRWPLAYTHKRLSISPEYADNFGIGRLVDKESGLYHTHQYSLFKTFYHRLLESPSRTLNADEAELFFIPFDLGMDSSTRVSDGALARTDCPTMSTAQRLLNSSKYFRASGGRDHFILHTINQLMLHFAHESCLELYKLCFNCTKLSIDSYDTSIYSALRDIPHLHHKWVSIPFPSNYHLSPDVTNAPWLTFRNPQIRKAKRPFSVCYMGSDQITAKAQRRLRIALRNECELRARTCLLVDLKTHDSLTDVFHNIKNNQTTNPASSHNNVDNPYLYSTFCLMPGGDFPTRKGFIDSMLSGCIPVTFQLFSAITQWKQHWGSLRNAYEASLFMQREQVMGNISLFYDTLEKLAEDSEVIESKRRKISEIGSRFQYRRPYAHQGDINSKNIKINEEEDAVDVIMKALFSES